MRRGSWRKQATPKRWKACASSILGEKKGRVTSILKQMGKLSPEERPVIGELANKVRAFIEDDLTKRAAELKAQATQKRLEEERLDVTLPGKHRELGVQASALYCFGRDQGNLCRHGL